MTGGSAADGSALPPQASAAPGWEDPPRTITELGTAPLLSVAGFEGPLDWLLEQARAGRIDLARLSILALVEAFGAALDRGLAQRGTGPAPDLARWGDWLVMAATLTWLRSRLLLPPEAPEARAAQGEAEALRRQVLDRAAMQAAADWLERQNQLGREVFARGRAETANAVGRGADITDLLRACLVALRLPRDAASDQLRRRPALWRMADAIGRIRAILAERPGEGVTLGVFLPIADANTAEHALRCRAALASTFGGALELAREGAIAVAQAEAFGAIQVQIGQKPLVNSGEQTA